MCPSYPRPDGHGGGVLYAPAASMRKRSRRLGCGGVCTGRPFASQPPSPAQSGREGRSDQADRDPLPGLWGLGGVSGVRQERRLINLGGDRLPESRENAIGGARSGHNAIGFAQKAGVECFDRDVACPEVVFNHTVALTRQARTLGSRIPRWRRSLRSGHQGSRLIVRGAAIVGSRGASKLRASASSCHEATTGSPRLRRPRALASRIRPAERCARLLRSCTQRRIIRKPQIPA